MFCCLRSLPASSKLFSPFGSVWHLCVNLEAALRPTPSSAFNPEHYGAVCNLTVREHGSLLMAFPVRSSAGGALLVWGHPVSVFTGPAGGPARWSRDDSSVYYLKACCLIAIALGTTWGKPTGMRSAGTFLFSWSASSQSSCRLCYAWRHSEQIPLGPP